MGVFTQALHSVCLYTLDGKEFNIADNWKQPPYTKQNDIRQHAALKGYIETKVPGGTLVHRKVKVVQGGEGSCTPIAFVRAFSVAHAIASNHPDIHGVATGIWKDGSLNNNWAEDNSCFAKLVHRLMRIYENIKFIDTLD